MILHNKYCILDFETTGADPNYAQPVSIGATMLDGRRLTICENGTFYSLVNIVPDEDVDNFNLRPLEQKALDVNKLTLEQVRAAPPLKKVWGDFCDWVKYHNPKNDQWDAPLLCAYNLDYDKTIAKRIQHGHLNGQIVLADKLLGKTKISKSSDEELATAYKSIKQYKEPWKFGPNTLFHPSYNLDIMQITIALFENLKEPHKYNFDLVKEFLGFSNVNSHNALVDSLYGAEVLARYLRLFREISNDIDFNTNNESILNIFNYIKEEQDNYAEECPF